MVFVYGLGYVTAMKTSLRVCVRLLHCALPTLGIVALGLTSNQSQLASDHSPHRCSDHLSAFPPLAPKASWNNYQTPSAPCHHQQITNRTTGT